MKFQVWLRNTKWYEYTKTVSYFRKKFVSRSLSENWKLKIGNSRKAGFTLLETVVALALIVAAALGPLTLTARGIISAKFGRSKLIALNLAQEGVEIIRHMRENNVLAGYDWRTSGLCSGCARLDIEDSYQVDVFTDKNGLAPPVASSCVTSPLRIATDPGDPYYGIYFQSAGVVQSAPTPYCRVITISTPAANQMKVISQISWSEGGFDRSIQVEEVMYNWQ